MKGNEKAYILAAYIAQSDEKDKALDEFNLILNDYKLPKSHLPLSRELLDLIKEMQKSDHTEIRALYALSVWRRYHEQFEKVNVLTELIERFNLRGE